MFFKFARQNKVSKSKKSAEQIKQLKANLGESTKGQSSHNYSLANQHPDLFLDFF